MNETDLAPGQRMRAIDDELAHVWMVRAFLNHCDEAVDDEELASVHRDLYDYMLALGPSRDADDSAAYLKLAHKKFGKLSKACELFQLIQPEVSSHTNFKMAAISLQQSVRRIEQLLKTSSNKPDRQ